MSLLYHALSRFTPGVGTTCIVRPGKSAGNGNHDSIPPRGHDVGGEPVGPVLREGPVAPKQVSDAHRTTGTREPGDPERGNAGGSAAGGQGDSLRSSRWRRGAGPRGEGCRLGDGRGAGGQCFAAG